MSEINKKVAEIKTFLLTVGAIIAAVMGGFWWLQDSIVERNKEVIKTSVIESIKKEIDPMDRASYMEFRRRDSIERLNAELLALDFMNRQDSLLLVIASETNARKSQDKRLANIELMLATDTVDKVDDKLAMIFEFLKEQADKDSVRFKVQMDMEARSQRNEGLIENIKSGDRLK